MVRTALWLSLAASAVLFALARAWNPYPGDLSLARSIQELDAPGLLAAMEFLSRIGEELPMGALHLIVIAALWSAGMRTASAGGLLVLLSVATNPLMKLIVDRDRPAEHLLVRATEDFSGLGFPSGHVFQSTLFFGFLIYLSSFLIKRMWLRRAAQSALAILIFAMGFSRVYIGAHWPSDVLGAIVVAVPIGIIIYLHHERVASLASRFTVVRSIDD